MTTARTYRIAIADKTFTAASGERVPVLHDLAFELEAEAFTCLIGPSGCGKTTILRIIMDLDDVFDGAIDPALSEGRIGAVFQEPQLLPWRSVEDNVRLALPEPLKDRKLGDLFEDVGLSAFRASYPSELSLGMARRVALVRAFAIEPDFLVLDEPFVSLDEATAARLRAALVSLWRKAPVTVLMVTHNLDEALALADRIVVLSDRPAGVSAIYDIAEPIDGRSADILAGHAVRLRGLLKP